MLRYVCDCCGSVIDGEPNIGKEYPDAVLLLDDDIEIMFDNLCPKCRTELKSAISKIGKPKPKPVKVEEPKQEPEPPEIEPEPQEIVALDEPLPEQVTKQFPITIRRHS